MNTKKAMPEPPLTLHRKRPEEEEALRQGGVETRDLPRWPWHHGALLLLRSQLVDERDEQAMEASEPIEASAEAPADAGTDAFDHDMSFALLAHEEEMLREIDGALKRIAAGTYGICEESGERIPAARLRAIPWTRYTKDVAELHEQQGRTPGPHLGALRSVSGQAPAEPRLVEEMDELAPERGEGRTHAGPGENADHLTEEDSPAS